MQNIFSGEYSQDHSLSILERYPEDLNTQNSLAEILGWRAMIRSALRCSCIAPVACNDLHAQLRPDTTRGLKSKLLRALG